MGDIRLTVHIPNAPPVTGYAESRERIIDFVRDILVNHHIPGDVSEFGFTRNHTQQLSPSVTFEGAGFINGDELYIVAGSARGQPYEDMEEVSTAKVFNQLGILVLDGSLSMKEAGAGGITLAEHVNRAVREFLGEFKNNSSIKPNVSVAIVTFDERATLHTPPTELEEINDMADYNPMRNHGGNTNIGVALEMAAQLADKHLESPEARDLPSMATIIVLSDGACLSPDYTRQVIERLKRSPWYKQDKILICASYFKNNKIAKEDEERATLLLQEMVSMPNLFITSYDYKHLRNFFIGSMSARKRYGKQA